MLYEKERMIKFMEEKNRILKERHFITPNYFTDEDAKIIKYWGNEKARKVYNHLINNVWINDCDICPFCIEVILEIDGDIYGEDDGVLILERCEICKYGKNHGICHFKDSDYHKIVADIFMGIFKRFTSDDIKNLKNILIEKGE